MERTGESYRGVRRLPEKAWAAKKQTRMRVECTEKASGRGGKGFEYYCGGNFPKRGQGGVGIGEELQKGVGGGSQSWRGKNKVCCAANEPLGSSFMKRTGRGFVLGAGSVMVASKI